MDLVTVICWHLATIFCVRKLLFYWVNKKYVDVQLV